MNEQKNPDIDRWQSIMEIVPNEKITLAPYFAHQIKYKIRHLLFSFARYKFAARMIGDAPQRTVIEFGCNEGLGTLHLAEVAKETLAVDSDARAIAWANQNIAKDNLRFIYDDFLGKKYGDFDFMVSLDVIEHIEQEKEEIFLESVLNNLHADGCAIIGTPNITAAQYSSPQSQIGHINLYDHERLKNLFLKGFKNVFLFGMNDEVIHTGFLPMCHYLIILACGKK